MNKNYIWAIVGIIVIALGIIVFAGKKQTVAPTQSTSQVQGSNEAIDNNIPNQTSVKATVNVAVLPKAISVSYTDNGFSPANVTVALGGTVTFTNNSTGDMWIASNPHPTHTDYPGFDEKTSVGPRGGYIFTFTKVGSWGYHNHRHPSDLGTVTVK